jgi:hypothetical protein
MSWKQREANSPGEFYVVFYIALGIYTTKDRSLRKLNISKKNKNKKTTHTFYACFCTVEILTVCDSFVHLLISYLFLFPILGFELGFYKADTFPLEPCLQTVLIWLFWK